MGLRVARETDAAEIVAIYAPFIAVTAISFELEAPSVDEMARRIRETLVGFPWLVSERDGRIDGYAYGGLFRTRTAYQWSAEVSVYIAADAHRRGIGRRLYRALFGILEGQGYRTLLAGTTLPNPASVGLHESMGFEPVGVYRNVGFKHGRWHDVGWWQRPMREDQALPDAAPATFSKWRKTAPLQSMLEEAWESPR